MSDAIIKVENLGKKYRICHQAERQRYVALRDVLADKTKSIARRLWSAVANPRSAIHDPQSVEDFWALKDVSFEVKPGEVVGIIGRNGAGKSTLLKILSRITEPTTGRIELDGRVASLLEVGTGFHPELTGRENIYLNGAILGMTRVEIARKFDEIVAFAEVEKFLDTPVKRYSSGMHVRLAFAVAAHLEPEILIVDEVLAVGDTEFQKKCLGKMQDVVKGGGRTILFVSHNMAAVASLTSKAILLASGATVAIGPTSEVIQGYQAHIAAKGLSNAKKWGRGQNTSILNVQMVDAAGATNGVCLSGKSIKLRIELETDGSRGMSLELFLLDSSLQRLGIFSLFQFQDQELPRTPGRFVVELILAPLWLATGSYWFDVVTSHANIGWDHYVSQAVRMDVIACSPKGRTFELRESNGFGPLALDYSEPVVFEPLNG